MSSPDPWRAKQRHALPRIICLVLAWVCATAAHSAPAGWRSIAEPAATFRSWEGREVGAGAANPIIDVAVNGLHGRWLRFRGEVDEPRSGMQFLLNAYENGKLFTRSVQTRCVAQDSGRARCASILWVPPTTTRIRAVVWASLSPGHIHGVDLEVADAAQSSVRPDTSLTKLIDLVQEHYYRSAEVDWPAVRNRLASVPAPPPDVDPLPPLAQLLRDQLPGNRHTSVRLSSAMETLPPEIKHPTCHQLAEDAWSLQLPGALFTDDAEVRHYVDAAHRCMGRVPAGARWIVDLRDNAGGNMLPMLAAIEEFFPAGPLLTFLDGAGMRTGTVVLGSSGITQDGHVVVRYATHPGRRRTAPVAVWIDASCGSSCEAVAVAFRGRAGTRLIGKPTAGLTTGNTLRRVNDDYGLVLTEGYMGDRCGRMVPERIPPDVEIDPTDDDAAIGQLRRVDALASTVDGCSR